MQDDIQLKFQESIKEFGCLEDKPTIAVGVSGGADSTALVLLTHEWLSPLGGRAIALTVDHKLRPESSVEAQQVRNLMEKHGIEHHILEWDHAGIESDVHNQARRARLQLLTDWCKSNDVLRLFLAHTSDDFVETFVMHALRGSGIYGLASISKSSVINKVFVGRPLLSFTKSELKGYLTSSSVEWIEDPSNQNQRFFRSRVRHLLGNAVDELHMSRLALSARNLGRARSYIEAECVKAMVQLVRIFPQGYATIKLKEFRELHEEIALYALSACLMTISGKQVYKPRFEALKRVYGNLLSRWPGVSQLWGTELRLVGGELYIYRASPKCGYTMYRKDLNTWVWDDRFEIRVQNPEVVDYFTNTRTHIDTIVPKQIYGSMPTLVLKDKSKITPSRYDASRIEVRFMPSSPLGKLKFQQMNIA